MVENKEYVAPILLKDLGMRYPNKNSKRKYRYGLFKCFCGNEFEVQLSSIKTGNTKSCGCLTKTHKLSKHRLYKTWLGMMQRCRNINSIKYKDYGGRGITVCERWHSIENFIEDMYPTFEEGLSLDRIDIDGNYEPSNCRWATIEVQNRNTRLLFRTNTSGFRGVWLHKKPNVWRAGIHVNNIKVDLGLFKTSIEGAIAYNEYVIKNNLEHPLNIIPTKEV